jgi:hypothetical protein
MNISRDHFLYFHLLAFLDILYFLYNEDLNIALEQKGKQYNF